MRRLVITAVAYSGFMSVLTAQTAQLSGLVQDPHPEQNFFRRSDNYVLATRGIIAHTVSSFGLHSDYHRPSDIVRPDWDMSGAREDLKVFFTVGDRIAEADKMPEWKPGNEFKAKREAMLKGSK